MRSSRRSSLPASTPSSMPTPSRCSYTLKKPENIPENMLTEIPLNQSNDFLKMLFTLMESKKSQGVLNVDFGFENLLDMISPKKVMDDIRQVRKEIRYNYAKYAELEDGDPAKLDVGDKLNELFEEASNNYNNVMAMLPLAIEDIKTRLLLGAGGQQGGGNQIALGMLTMGDKGELKVLEAPKQESTALATLDDNVNTGLIAALQEDYQAINESPSDYVQSLVVRTFCPLPSTTQSKIDVPHRGCQLQLLSPVLQGLKGCVHQGGQAPGGEAAGCEDVL